MKRLLIAACVLLCAAPAFATNGVQAQVGCQVQALAVAPQVIYAPQPLVFQQLAVPYVQQQVVVQKQVVQKQRVAAPRVRGRSVTVQRQRFR